MLNRTYFLALLCTTIVLQPLPGIAVQPKELDSDVIYDEARVPHYDLPPLLVSTEGKAITTPEEWRNIRRPQIMALFSNLIYGAVPVPAKPLTIEQEIAQVEPDFMAGRATHKEVILHISNEHGKREMVLQVYTPNGLDSPAPLFLMHSFDDTRSLGFREHRKEPNKLVNGWPVGDFLDRGYGFAAVYQQDLVGHNEVEFLNSIHRLFYPEGQSFPKASEWGVLSAVAWGGMRAMDYLETDKDVDATRVAVMGHSKMGKSALWTAAQDERFAMVISAQSGAGGAALWRRKSGETLEKMVTRFPYWLCRNAWKFVGNEDDLPVDQHMLLALVAPRLVYVHSGTGDTWADARGEYVSAYHASEVYRLLGKKGLESEASPPEGQPIIDSDIGYHVRAGGHSIEPYDWERFMDFADYHWK